MRYRLTLIFVSAMLNLGAQSIGDVKNLYMNLTEADFRVSTHSFDADRNIHINTLYYYHMAFKDSSKDRVWYNFDLENAMVQINCYSVYSPLTAKTTVYKQDTIETFNAVTKWDSMGCETQGTRVFGDFIYHYPFVKCFFDLKKSELKRKIRVKNGLRYFYHIHPYLGGFNTVFLSENLLIDSIHIKAHAFSKQYRLIRFDYESLSLRGKPYYENPKQDSLFPLSVDNPYIREMVKFKYEAIPLLHSDSQRIKEFYKSTSSKYTLVDFWFIGCRPCQKSLPLLQKIDKEFDERTVRVLCMNPLEKQETIDYFKSKFNWKLNLLHDSLRSNLFYNVKVYPRTFLLDANGSIIMEHEGHDELFFEKLREFLRKNE